MPSNSHKSNMRVSVDWVAILIYVTLAVMGWFNIYAAVYNPSQSAVFDFSQRYGIQLLWMGVAFFIGIAILLIDVKYYHMIAYPLYIITLLLLVATLFVGKEVNGAKSWLYFGSIGLQPAEFAKFTTSLAVARYMSNYHFSIKKLANLLGVGVILGLPVMIIMLQNDTGSALVYGSFLFMLYREGFNRWLYVMMILLLLLFVLSFLLDPLVLLMLLFLGCVIAEGVANGRWRMKIIYVAGVLLLMIIIYIGYNLLHTSEMSLYKSLLISIFISFIAIGVYAYRTKARNILQYAGLFLGALMFTWVVGYVFENFMQLHQQKRVLDLLGVESDLKGWGYNVNQSKIAIGSGGFMGKGYLEGTQTKYNFVPEQSTDFIFCTVGEEWGFVGSALVLILFSVLILRIMRMGERHQEAFGRIYCYCVASIFFFHLVVNVGMTIGLMPVIGIPLPFFSYGGSSMLAFTILFFVAVKLDASKRESILMT